MDRGRLPCQNDHQIIIFSFHMTTRINSWVNKYTNTLLRINCLWTIYTFMQFCELSRVFEWSYRVACRLNIMYWQLCVHLQIGTNTNTAGNCGLRHYGIKVLIRGDWATVLQWYISRIVTLSHNYEYFDVLITWNI